MFYSLKEDSTASIRSSSRSVAYVMFGIVQYIVIRKS
jgi:hypothetical protein